jgi:hypothetical protein
MHSANSKFDQLCLYLFGINKTCGNIVCCLNKDSTMARRTQTPRKHLIISIRQTQNLTGCVSVSFFASTKKHVEILFAISIRILQWLEELGQPLSTLLYAFGKLQIRPVVSLYLFLHQQNMWKYCLLSQ